MKVRYRTWRATVGACLTAAVVASCGSHPAAAPTAQAPGSTPSALSSTPPPVPDTDVRACVGVQAILTHITVDTAHWSPNVRPFDQAVAVRLASQARQLDSQALAAGLQVRRAVAATSTAFGGVAEAMMAKDRARLTRAIAQSQHAYTGLKQACRIHH